MLRSLVALGLALSLNFALPPTQTAALAQAPKQPAAAEGEAPTLGRFMVSAAHPLASEAGYEVLKQGGSAVDAAVAIQMVLTLVEPQSSGIGGGAFMLHWDAEAGELTTYDGRETAPASLEPTFYLKADGTPLTSLEALVGGQFTGVPGVVALLEKAHGAHGELLWSPLFRAAIEHAQRGFEVTPRLHQMIRNAPTLRQLPGSNNYFYTQLGTALPVGSTLRNPALADALLRIAAGGSEAFYRGALAETIVETVQTSPVLPGVLSLEDMAGYDAKIRPNLCAPYRGYTVCGMGPPSSGGFTVLQTLRLLERFDLAALGAGSAASIHLISEAQKLAYADRNKYLADTDFVEVPVDALLSDDYIADRSALIEEDSSAPPATAGVPPLREGRATPYPDYALAESGETPSTSHFSVIDGKGNAVSMTTSVEARFGSHLLASGFLLNNQLRDFAKRPVVDGQPVANAPAPGKRPRSSMSPTIVFNPDGSLRLLIGSPGGSRIITYVTKTIIGVLDHGLSVQAAIDLPHHANRNGPTELEEGRFRGPIQKRLQDLGHDLRLTGMNSGLHGIEIVDGTLRGGADPRREGVVLEGP